MLFVVGIFVPHRINNSDDSDDADDDWIGRGRRSGELRPPICAVSDFSRAQTAARWDRSLQEQLQTTRRLL